MHISIDVSIILPVYNIQEEYLRKCINSIRNQTKREIEIILVDDGSKNNCLDVCLECQKIDDRIVVISQENQGVSIARNTGINVAKGSWISFVDPDDWLENDLIQTLFEKTEDGIDIVICDCYVNYSNKEIPNSFLNTGANVLSGDNKNKLSYQLICKKMDGYYPNEVAVGVPWAKLFRKSFIDSNNLTYIPGMVRMQDNIFCLYAFELARNIVYVPHKLYHYRKEDTSVCFRYNPNIVNHFEKYFFEVGRYFEKYGKNAKYIDGLRTKILTSFNSYILYKYFHKDNQLSYIKVRKEINKLLNKDVYKDALINVKFKYLNFQEIIFILCLKFRLIEIIYLLVKVRNRYKKGSYS